MGQTKELLRKQINAAAGHYLTDQEDGDLYDAYLALKELKEAGKGDEPADYVIDMWEPLQTKSISEVIDLIEGSIEEPEVPEFMKAIDWNMLRHQKTSLIAVKGYYEKMKVPFIPEHLEGIISLLDAMHDYAIDDVEISEALEEEQAYVKLVNTIDESPEQKFARTNAQLIFEIAIEGDALYCDADNPCPREFIEKTVDDSFHSDIIKARMRQAIYSDVTKFPKDFKRDANGDYTYDAEMSDYGFLIGEYCKEIYPGD